MHFWDPSDGGNGNGNGNNNNNSKNEEQIDLGASDLGAFYEEEEEDESGPRPPTIFAPLPEVVPVHIESMDFGGNGGNSLLGMWTANSNNSHSQGGMDLAGESCDPLALRDQPKQNLVFLPFQFDGDD